MAARDKDYRDAVRLLAAWCKRRIAALPGDLKPESDADGVRLALAYIVEDVTNELRNTRRLP